MIKYCFSKQVLSPKIIGLFFLFFFSSCCVKSYDLKYEKNKNDYDIDNIIYKKKRSFKYRVNVNNFNTDVKTIEFIILGGTYPFIQYDKDYKQTVFQINYLSGNNEILFSEMTGIVENEFNTWIHPPRSNEFNVLQSNSFPMFVNKKSRWNWQLEFSYKEFSNFIVKHSYKRKKVNQDYQILTESILIDKISKAKYIYNDKFGFKELLFENYDGSKIELILTEIIDEDGSYYFKE